MKYSYLGLCVGIFLVCTSFVQAQEVHQELQETVRGEVVQIVDTYERDVTGSDITATVQVMHVRLLEGTRANRIISLENDRLILEAGDVIYVNRLQHIDGSEYYALKDVDRSGPLILLGLFFAGLLLLFARWQGARALVSLLGSALVIVGVLVPLLLKGYPPVLTSVSISTVILAIALFVTHSFTARTTVAFVGTVGAVVLTGVIAVIWTDLAHLTGFGSDAAVYLNFSTQGELDIAGLLLGSIIIGVLGVLDDVAITQASVVQELKALDNTLGMRELYTRALRVGRDHVGSLVNTLALAYVGVSLPLVLLYVRAGTSIEGVLNQEIVAAELIRIMVGSCGLILAVPLTTLIAAWWFDRHVPSTTSQHHSHHGHGHQV